MTREEKTIRIIEMLEELGIISSEDRPDTPTACHTTGQISDQECCLSGSEGRTS